MPIPNKSEKMAQGLKKCRFWSTRNDYSMPFNNILILYFIPFAVHISTYCGKIEAIWDRIALQ